MKLISARFKNFRLLKDLSLDFSRDINKPLTVIRAANETGKTTSETALIWGFYGSKALPNKGVRFSLYPSDALTRGERKVEISVEIDFETDQVVSVGKGKQEIQTIHYRLLRSCIEYPSLEENVKRETEVVTLNEITNQGTQRVLDSNVKSIIENSIPEALKDVYFTDGDSAMSFIEAAATQGVKRKRVQDAVEALLGLQVLETTIKHLDSSAKKFGALIDNTNYSVKLEELNDRIDGYDEDVSDWSDELNNLESDISEGDSKLLSVKKQVENILMLGDKSKLANDIKNCESHILRNQEAEKKALLQLSSLMRNTDLAASMIANAANKGRDILTKLHEKKELPKVNIPILEELLTRSSCFCGAALDEESAEGSERHKSILLKIENSRSADELQEAASSLFYSVRSENFDSSVTDRWMEKYDSFFNDYSYKLAEEKRFKKELEIKNSEIDQIKDDQINELRLLESSLTKKLNAARVAAGNLSGQIKDTKERKLDCEIERNKIENKLDKKDNSVDKLRLSRLTKTVFEKVFDRLRTDEVQNVSREMNRIFLEMIGSDPDANNLAMITKAELTKDFDILVYGPSGHKLNPDQDLNGASRRAITLAFILALTKVSEVKAPNVIDTPLGMMSGYVKQSVLSKTLEEGSQVILFLTHDEIQGVENILDEKAGVVYTLTNPAHFPRMLINKPSTDDARIIRCPCNHRQTCEICARKILNNTEV
jgi:DNA sulfur modification protein DndD